MKIAVIAHIPDDLAKDWLQHLRNFDSAHAGCHFQIVADTTLSIEEVQRMVDIDPPLRFHRVFPREP